MTAVELRVYSRKELECMAKRHSIDGWRAMRKEELVKALVMAHKKKKRKTNRKGNSHTPTANSLSRKSPGKNGKAQTNGQTATAILRKNVNRSLCSSNFEKDSPKDGANDRITVQILNAYWLHASWNFSQSIIDRAKAALDVEWHQAVPVIRVNDAGGTEESSWAVTRVKDIEIHGKVDHWYIPLDKAPCSYQLQIGYRTPSGRFFSLARSNKVTTPEPGTPVTAERTLNETASSSRKNRTHSSDPASRNGKNGDPKRIPLRRFYSSASAIGANGNGRNHEETNGDFVFTLQAELIIHGTTHPEAELTLLGDPVQLDESGTYSLRMAFPEGRQVIPVVATTPDGVERRTIILGVERNTKELEPQPTGEPLL